MYHYVYRITNIALNKHYYGSRSCKILPKNDLGVVYLSSSNDKLFLEDQILNPQNYKYKIIYNFEDRKKALQFEIKLHKKFNVANNNNFYNKSNQTSSGFFYSALDYKWINNEEIEILVEIKEIDNYIKLGWIMGRLKQETPYDKITINKNGIIKKVKEEKIEYYISNGWILGSGISPNANKIYIHHKDLGRKFVPLDQKQDYLDKGWELGSNVSTCKDMIFVTKNKEIKRINNDELKIYLQNGWSKGTGLKANKGRISIFHNVLGEKKIPENELSRYIECGWNKGSKNIGLSGKKIINDGVNTISVAIDQIENYLSQGWRLGRLSNSKKQNRIYVYKEGVEKTIDKNEKDLYISDGWYLGRLKRK